MESTRPAIGGAHEFRGRIRAEFSPELDGEADPGEVVWAWVPYEEDPTQGKDRPLAVVGRTVPAEGQQWEFAVFMLSSRDRSGDDGWTYLGTGDWDHEHRPSWVRVDRPLAVSANAVRREGAVLTREQFELVLRAARQSLAAGN